MASAAVDGSAGFFQLTPVRPRRIAVGNETRLQRAVAPRLASRAFFECASPQFFRLIYRTFPSCPVQQQTGRPRFGPSSAAFPRPQRYTPLQSRRKLVARQDKPNMPCSGGNMPVERCEIDLPHTRSSPAVFFFAVLVFSFPPIHALSTLLDRPVIGPPQMCRVRRRPSGAHEASVPAGPISFAVGRLLSAQVPDFHRPSLHRPKESPAGPGGRQVARGKTAITSAGPRTDARASESACGCAAGSGILVRQPRRD